MASFNIPAGPKAYEINLSGFLGVDFSSSMTDIDKRRTPEGYNFVNNDGTIEKRNGFDIVSGTTMPFSNANGVWNIDATDGEFFVIHTGTRLCEVENFNGLNLNDIIYENLADTRSKGILMNKKLLIFDGKRAIVHDLQKTRGNRTARMDEIGYIPTTQIARSPDGLKSQSYEQINLISDKKINLFTSTETDTVYQLEDAPARVISVEIMDSNGEFQDANTLHISWDWNYSTGQVIFNSPIGLPPVDGRDNVRIKYIYTEEPEFSQINKCTIVRTYGYGGINNRIFLSGNPEYPNLVMWSDINNPLYFPVTNVINLGLETAPINELVRTNDGKLVALKATSDTDSTAFYLGYAMIDNQEWFPLEKSIKGDGNIGKYAHDTLINEPLILTPNGVFALSTGNETDEKYLYHKSYYIDTKLKNEPNLEEAVGITFKGKYYLAINNHVYVADSRFKSNSRYAGYSNFQYEWYYWTDMPVRTWFIWNDELYFGHKSGHICKIRSDDDEHRFWDGKYHAPGQVHIIGGKKVKAEWTTPILDLNSPARKKNIKRIAIQSNPTTSKLVVGYKLKGGDKEVLAKEYINSTHPKTTVIRKKAKKLSYFSLYIENEEDSNMSFNSVDVVYTVGSYYKGD